MQDIAFRPQACLPKVRAAFSELDIVELPEAKHFIQEDVPDQVTTAIAARFR